MKPFRTILTVVVRTAFTDPTVQANELETPRYFQWGEETFTPLGASQ